jgi:hypothetical protein
MIEVQLTTRSLLKTIATWDGRVLEFFFDELKGGSRRMHAGHIRSIEVTPVAHGKEKYSLTVKSEYQLVVVDVSEETLARAQELVAAVRAAIPSASQS